MLGIKPLKMRGKVETARKNLKDYILKKHSPGEKIASVRELEKALGVSRMTVYSAISGLAAEGIIYSIHGSGYYVADRKAEKIQYKGSIGFMYMNVPVSGASGLERECFMTKIIEGFQEECREFAYRLLPFNALDKKHCYSKEELSAYNVLVVHGTPSEPLVQVLSELEIPIIIMNSSEDFDWAVKIVVNQEKLMNYFLNELKSFGHERIGLICYLEKFYNSFASVYKEVFGIDYEQSDCVMLRDDEKSEPDYNRIKEIFKQKEKIPRCFLLVDEFITNRFMEECIARKVSIPEDVSIIVMYYLNDYFNGVSCRLTCVDLFKMAFAFGAEAGISLKKILAGKLSKGEVLYVEPFIFHGNSVRKIKI